MMYLEKKYFIFLMLIGQIAIGFALPLGQVFPKTWSQGDKFHYKTHINKQKLLKQFFSKVPPYNRNRKSGDF